MSRWLAPLAALAIGGCNANQSRGYPLYPATGSEPLPEELSRLTGYVKYVDGEDVSRYGSTFRLLPGCHLVRTPRAWGHTESTYGGVVVKTGELAFALPMRAGYTYVIAIETEQTSGLVGKAEVRAYERTASGEATREFSPVRDGAEVAACRAEAPRPSSLER
ncbi:MAG: hypothetical protein JW751_24080 [Polyangiaceae bacterium]|nr:hypothetical protein [Polyangiaceae bacterium]